MIKCQPRSSTERSNQRQNLNIATGLLNLQFNNNLHIVTQLVLWMCSRFDLYWHLLQFLFQIHMSFWRMVDTKLSFHHIIANFSNMEYLITHFQCLLLLWQSRIEQYRWQLKCCYLWDRGCLNVGFKSLLSCRVFEKTR